MYKEANALTDFGDLRLLYIGSMEIRAGKDLTHESESVSSLCRMGNQSPEGQRDLPKTSGHI